MQRFFAAPQDGPGHRHLVESVVEPVPMELPRSRYGNPEIYQVGGKFYETMDSSVGYHEQGIASWYGSKFHGRLTSSREVYDMYQLTAAHRSLPIPTFVEVTNLENGKSLIVKVNDRGPFHDDRLIDLSYGAAVKLDIISKGTARVDVRAIDPAQTVRKHNPVQITQVVVPASNVATSVNASSAVEPEPLLSSQGKGVFVQLGAFSDELNAISMKNRVESIVPGAAVGVTPSAARDIYRVQLGPVYSQSLIAEIVRDLERGGVSNYHLITN